MNLISSEQILDELQKHAEVLQDRIDQLRYELVEDVDIEDLQDDPSFVNIDNFYGNTRRYAMIDAYQREISWIKSYCAGVVLNAMKEELK